MGRAEYHKKIKEPVIMVCSEVDVCMTATKRPDIIERTLESFCRLLFKGRISRLIINIDPVGDNVDVENIISMARKYTLALTAHCPKNPSFSKAFKWCWDQVQGKHVFHLEDDWELLIPVDFSKMVSIMDRITNLAALRLPMWRTADTSKNWSVFFPWNGEFFECPTAHVGSVGFCGHPSLLNGKFVRNVAPLLSPHRNPEKQIKWRNSLIGPIVQAYRFGVFAEQNSPPVVRDTGREWRAQKQWCKKGNREHFTEWERIR
jgi:hypothetical protein